MGTHPGLLERIKALTIDSMMIILFLFLFSMAVANIENIPDEVRMGVYAFIFLLYDPLFTTIIGGTIGHRMMGLKVKNMNNPNKNIIFPLAVIRFMVKTVLGAFSLMTVSSHPEKRAIHDFVASSIVVYD